MQTWKIMTPLLLSLALFGCNKADNASNTADATGMTGKQHQQAREEIMKSWGKANKAMGGMMKDPTTFNAQTFKAEADKLNQDPWGHFTAESKGGEAKDAVWSDAAGFQQEIDKYKAAAAALTTAAATATSADAVKTQHADLAASCKSCHEKFKAD